jgi:hemerythrin-like domain-containing protein
MPSRRHDHEQPMNALALLKADHQWIIDLFAQYEAASNPDTKRTLAAQVFVELESHAQLEANVFYPTVHEETDEGPALVKASMQEHQTMTQLIQELRGMAHDTDAFDTKFQELLNNVEHHVEEEEADMFPLAEEALADDLDEMRKEMQELKADRKAHKYNDPPSPVYAVQGTPLAVQEPVAR